MWYELGCIQWKHHAKWPGPESADDCCLGCHKDLLHTAYRNFDGFGYPVCCGVKALCLKKLAHSMQSNIGDYLLSGMTFEQWYDKWKIPKESKPVIIQAWLDTYPAAEEVLTNGAGYEIIITDGVNSEVVTTINAEPNTEL